MHRNDRARPRRDCAGQRVGVEVVVGADIDQDRRSPDVDDRRHRRRERVTDRHDFVAGADAGGEQREMQRVIAAVHPHRIVGADELRQVLLEIPELLPEHEIAPSQRVGERGIDLRFEPPVVFARIHERDAIGQASLLLRATT
jgi:hypothetical protein